ncbi:hypothetical protein [Microbacterium sp. gxy059]|uniref:hypothetical protein n=1 Tax=Microbacterium sp. gxy059 TaxID=2957199 RepID=UPI003D98F1C0
MSTMIPDRFDTAVAIDTAESMIATQRDLGYHPWEAEDAVRGVIAHVVMAGGSLAQARSHAIITALVRDACPTAAENAAMREVAA